MRKFRSSPWNLTAIRIDIQQAMREIGQKASVLEKKKRLLTNTISVKQFLQLLKQLEALSKHTTKLGVYVHLRFCENAEDQRAVAEMSQVESFIARINNRLLFFSLWFKALPEKKAKQLIKAAGKYWYYFELLWRNRRYTLQENEERIINVKDITGVSALNNIYNMLTSGFTYYFQGKTRTQEEMITFVRSSSAKTRKEAYQTILIPYRKHKTILGEIYKNIINDWREEQIALRGYNDPLNVRNVGNDLPDAAVDSLLKVCKKNQHIFHRFFEIKRKKLGLKKLRRYDLYAPLQEEKKTISYDKAVTLVLETFGDFASEFRRSAESILHADHVHAVVQKGKHSGAFCCPATVDLPPYVLLSYTGKYRDISTLAHELGHGVHFMLAQQQTEFTYDACLPLAETASIFSEMLLSEKVMQADPKAAKQMLFTKLDDLYASIIRQAGFVMFEQKAHELMRQGKTIDEMSAVYLQDLRRQLGPKVEVDDIFAYEWAYIPHIFHTPFYCYAYAFGNLLTLAIYEMYKEQGKKFVPKILQMLAVGGSMPPIKIAQIVGADITSEKFWQKGFDVIKEMIEKIEK